MKNQAKEGHEREYPDLYNICYLKKKTLNKHQHCIIRKIKIKTYYQI